MVMFGRALRPAPEERVASNAAVAACLGDLLLHPGVEILEVRWVELVDADEGHRAQQLDDLVDALPGGHACARGTCGAGVEAQLS